MGRTRLGWLWQLLLWWWLGFRKVMVLVMGLVGWMNRGFMGRGCGNRRN